MFIRMVIYSHVAAVALTGLAAYWDRVGSPGAAARILYWAGCMAAALVAIYPIVWLAILASSQATARQKWLAVVVGAPATVAHLIAAMPLVQ